MATAGQEITKEMALNAAQRLGEMVSRLPLDMLLEQGCWATPGTARNAWMVGQVSSDQLGEYYEMLRCKGIGFCYSTSLGNTQMLPMGSCPPTSLVPIGWMRG
jgi:hypothetical protein